MLNIIADTHTHTLATDHAYSTVSENAAAAAERGLLAMAMTEHSPSMPGAPGMLHFNNLGMIPREINGVTIIKGIEVNIMDYDGALDLPHRYLQRLEWVIASMHTTNLDPASQEEHTRGWLNVAKNPLVDVIGHCGDGRYAFDYERVLPEFKKHDKIVEINSHSFYARPNSEENCETVARLCKMLEIPVVVSSDAHFHNRIGDFGKSIELLEQIDFPERLILNADRERFFSALESRKAYKQ